MTDLNVIEDIAKKYLPVLMKLHYNPHHIFDSAIYHVCEEARKKSALDPGYAAIVETIEEEVEFDEIPEELKNTEQYEDARFLKGFALKVMKEYERMINSEDKKDDKQ